MWKCSKCGEGVEESFEVCWNCQHVRGPDDRDSPSDDNSGTTEGSGNEAAFLTRPELGAMISRTLACIILSVCLFQGLGFVVLLFSAMAESPWNGIRLANFGEPFLPLVITFGILVAFGLFFWCNAGRIGRGLVGGDEREITGIPVDLSPAFFGTTIQIVGLVLFVEGLRQFVSIAYFTFRLELDQTEFWDTAGMMNVLASLGLGSWMLLGSNGIAKGITWLRTVGTPTSIHPSADDQS